MQFIVKSNGGSIQIKEVSEDGRTQLHDAAGEGQVEILKYLLACRDIDINKHDVNGYTTLHYAAESGHFVAASVLVADKNVDINASDEGGKTALHYSSGEWWSESMSTHKTKKGKLHCTTQQSLIKCQHWKTIDIKSHRYYYKGQLW